MFNNPGLKRTKEFQLAPFSGGRTNACASIRSYSIWWKIFAGSGLHVKATFFYFIAVIRTSLPKSLDCTAIWQLTVESGMSSQKTGLRLHDFPFHSCALEFVFFLDSRRFPVVSNAIRRPFRWQWWYYLQRNFPLFSLVTSLRIWIVHVVLHEPKDTFFHSSKQKAMFTVWDFFYLVLAPHC